MNPVAAKCIINLLDMMLSIAARHKESDDRKNATPKTGKAVYNLFTSAKLRLSTYNVVHVICVVCHIHHAAGWKNTGKNSCGSADVCMVYVGRLHCRRSPKLIFLMSIPQKVDENKGRKKSNCSTGACERSENMALLSLDSANR